MRILYLSFSFQHPSLRGPTRCYHFLRELSRRHEITLLSASRIPVPPEAKQEVARYTKHLQVFGCNGTPTSQTGRLLGRVPRVGRRLQRQWEYSLAVRKMKAALKQLVQQNSYDVLLFHGIDIFPAIKDLDELPIVIDFCDATSMLFLRQMAYSSPAKWVLLGLRYLRMRRLEKRLTRKGPHLAFISRRDRDAVLGPGQRAEVLPIGVDSEFWKRQSEYPNTNTIIFVGVMNYAPNADAATYLLDEIVPRVRKEVPDLEVYIVGRDPSRVLREKARQQAGVHVTGFVDDVRPYLERSAVAVAPIRYGAGILNKVLEAMAMEVPVVTTTLAADGLRVEGEPELPLCVADDAGEFAARLVALLRDPAARVHLARAGRQFVQRNYVWSRSVETLERMCYEAAAQARSEERRVAQQTSRTGQEKRAERSPC